MTTQTAEKPILNDYKSEEYQYKALREGDYDYRYDTKLEQQVPERINHSTTDILTKLRETILAKFFDIGENVVWQYNKP